MPTNKPRLTVTLDDQTHIIVERLSSLQDRSKSSLICELLQSYTPIMERLISTIEYVKTMEESERESWVSNCEQAQDAMEGVLSDAFEQMDLVFLANGKAGKVGNPPPTNRGVVNSKRGKSVVKKTHKEGFGSK
jgi:hypothetical protein